MLKAADLPRVLPVFPLPGALLLPRSRLPLHLFEPRYLQMLEDVLKTSQRLVGMIQPCPSPTANDGLHVIGCAGRVTQFSETEDGRYMITLTGISRFRIKTEVEGFSPYRRFDVNFSGFERDLDRSERDPKFNRQVFMELLRRFFAARDLSTDWEILNEAEDELLINSLCMLLDFDPEEKQALLEAPCLATRRETLATLIEFSMRGGGIDEVKQ